ncbi:glycosyltransferase [Myxococcaceae bacterium GXIMD 01537]
MNSTRPRVLLIAEMCNPDWVSVPLEGWALYRALAEVADVHLVTHLRNRENLLKAGVPEDAFTALDTGAVDKPLEKVGGLLRGKANLGWTTFTALGTVSYYLFEALLLKQFGARLRAREFDLVHRLTPISPTTPSVLAPVCEKLGVPFVLGPLNGGLPWPKGFGAQRRREREWLSYVREAYKLMPGYRATRNAAAAIMTGSRATRQQVGATWQGKTVYVPENAVDLRRFGTARAEASSGLPLRVCFVGRFVPYKGADMLLEAAAPLVRAGQVQVELIGDGAEMENLRAQVAREGLGEGVQFAGWVKHQHLQERLARNHVFGFPSIREFGGAVVAEAMALGLVPIVMDYGGPGEIVSPATGFAVPMGPREQIVAGVREVLERLVADPSVIGPMGERARARILKSFTWEAKALQVLEVYRWVLRERGQPDWGMPLAD